MSERGQHEGVEFEAEAPGREGAVRIHETRPGRRVFTEDGNTDGWIATDVAVDVEP